MKCQDAQTVEECSDFSEKRSRFLAGKTFSSARHEVFNGGIQAPQGHSQNIRQICQYFLHQMVRAARPRIQFLGGLSFDGDWVNASLRSGG